MRVRRRRLGGWAVGGAGASRFLRVSHGDEVDAASAQFFVNSSLAPVLLFPLRGVRRRGFSSSRVEALHRYWGAVCRVDLFSLWSLGFIGFHKCVF